jgi:hypothetical protein
MVSLVIRANNAVGLFYTPSGYTAPGVAEAITPDSLMTISPLPGEDFGSADITHRIFEDFRGQTDGASPSSTPVRANNSSWTQTNGEIDTAQGIISDRSWYHSGNGVILKGTWPYTSDGCRYSFWLLSALSDAQIAGGRSKTAWLESDNGVGAEFDLAYPTKMSNGGAGWGSAGNDFNLQTGIGPHLAANEWTRFMAAYSRTLGWKLTSCSPTFGVQIYQGTDNVLAMGTTDEQVNGIFFGATTDPAYHYGGIQVHTGLGVNASIELGDQENYDDCDFLWDCDIVTWGSQVQAYARIPASVLVGQTPLYLHGHKADRTHFNASRNGRPVSLS